MSLPQLYNDDEHTPEFVMFVQIMSNLSQQYFKGRNDAILNEFIEKFSLEDRSEFFSKVVSFLGEKVNIEANNFTEIEQIDILKIANEFKGLADIVSPANISKDESDSFESTLKEFGRAALHDVAFPLLLIESPNSAIAVKNLIKRTFASISNEGVEVSKIYEDLDIENLPDHFSIELLNRLGGRIPGLEQVHESNTGESENSTENILCCELSIEQALYLANILEEDYDVIKKGKPFYNLLKSNGKKYESVIVKSEKKGILLSVLNLLYERKTIASGRYLYMSKGKGFWRFFQQYLIDSRTDTLFKRDLRKLCSEFDCEKEAQKIVDELFSAEQKNAINIMAKDIAKKFKL